MKNIIISDGAKRKLEQSTDRNHRSVREVLDEPVSRALPVNHHSVRDLLKAKIDDPLTAEDFDAHHETMMQFTADEFHTLCIAMFIEDTVLDHGSATR